MAITRKLTLTRADLRREFRRKDIKELKPTDFKRRDDMGYQLVEFVDVDGKVNVLKNIEGQTGVKS